MENLPGNLEKDVMFFTPPTSSKPKKQWTLILLGDHGEIINVGWLKGAALAGMLFLIAALAAAAYFYVLYRNAVQENSGARHLTRTAQQRAAPQKAGTETSPSASEPKVGKTPAPTQKSPATESAGGSQSPVDKSAAATEIKATDAEMPENSRAEASEESAAGDEAQIPAETASPLSAEKPAAVSAENFEIFYNKSRKILEVKFDLKNTDPNESRASGQVFVVLKSEQLNPNRWLTLPETELISGKPSGKEPGEAFNISRFKTVRLEAKGQPAPSRFDAATVFVFSETGELLLEKDFPVNTE